ncbi:MAG: 16S rRNA (guanine(527)-N(7))-methyltransferase RsmG [Bacteroidota bacterium]|jgi:16S rRNA (guanine527-N7)-methyltransferase
MHPEKKIWFRKLCIKNGLTLNNDQLEQLDYYVVLLLEWNKKINIISRKDEENVWTYHILHSISPLFKIEIKQNSAIVDIGTGGGLPGIPIKILRPDLSMLCIDSTGKKINAVLQMISDIKLNNIHALWGRAEEAGSQPEYARKFDFAIARAVAPLKDLLSWSKIFLKSTDPNRITIKTHSNGRVDPNPPALLAFKGGNVSEEIEIAKRKHQQINIQSIDLIFNGSEQLIASDKKILVVHF